MMLMINCYEKSYVFSPCKTADTRRRQCDLPVTKRVRELSRLYSCTESEDLSDVLDTSLFPGQREEQAKP